MTRWPFAAQTITHRGSLPPRAIHTRATVGDDACEPSAESLLAHAESHEDLLVGRPAVGSHSAAK
ncbi:hypothetical protein [Nocardia mikamii]|uniref:hypothetical protein n=1 Tax=Nocardia mikamii TaxID=508464 RepID=UPI0007A41132|nr:hypothetical protein [Nocardia mikamii]